MPCLCRASHLHYGRVDPTPLLSLQWVWSPNPFHVPLPVVSISPPRDFPYKHTIQMKTPHMASKHSSNQVLAPSVQKLWKCQWMAPVATWLGTFTGYSQGTRRPRVLLASHFNLARGGTKPVVLDHYVDDRQHQPFQHYPGLKNSWLLAPPLDQRITCMKEPDAETSAKRREQALSLCLQRQQPQCPPHGLYSQSQKNALGPIILFLWLT